MVLTPVIAISEAEEAKIVNLVEFHIERETHIMPGKA
jgi:hypothetical protein